MTPMIADERLATKMATMNLEMFRTTCFAH